MDESGNANQASENNRLEKLGQELEQIEKKAQKEVVSQPAEQVSESDQNLDRPEFQNVAPEVSSAPVLPEAPHNDGLTQTGSPPELNTPVPTNVPEVSSTPESVLPPPPPTPTQPTSDQPASKAKKSNLLIWVGIAILLATLLAVGIYVLFSNGTINNPLPGSTPAPELSNIPSSGPVATPDPLAAWNLYENSAYDYKIKYPEDWRTTLTGGSGSSAAESDSKALTILQLDSEGSTTSGSLDLQFLSTEPTYPTSSSSSQVTINSNQATKYVFESSTAHVFELPSGKGILEVATNLSPNGNTNLLLGTILNTLELVESEESILGVRVNCESPRPELCTQEYLETPPYICGSDGRQYGNTCMACGNSAVDYYTTQNEACSSN